MAGVNFHSVSKFFGKHQAVSNVSMTIKQGELLAFLGPSGCGKTTLLRLIAGFESPSSGSIDIGGRTVADGQRSIPPEKRGIGMVFQSYALWPHMTVAENVGFALRLRRMPRGEQQARIVSALELVGLGKMAARKPHQLSGGQRQRVALARCLAMQPDVILLDEPLANLDAHLRDTMQQEFKRLHRETGATFVIVTHDQAEAMALADRIAVMSDGRIEQLAAPRELYRQPRTAMVARFVGSGMVFPVDVLDRRPGEVTAQFYGAHFPLRGEASTGDRRLACVRASDLALGGAGSGGFACIVCDLNYKGPVTTVVVSPVSDPSRQFHVDHPGAPPALGERTEISIRDGWLLEEAPA